MTVLFLFLIVYILMYRYKVDFDYIREENLLLIFYSAKNGVRECLKFKL